MRFYYYYILSILLVLSCQEYTWDNPVDPGADIELSQVFILDINVISHDKLEISWLDTTDHFTGYELYRTQNSSDSVDVYSLAANLKLENLTYNDTSIALTDTTYITIDSDSMVMVLPTFGTGKYLTYTDSTISLNQNYYYSIRGIADNNPGPYSEVSFKMLTFSGPDSLKATILNDQAIRLDWDYEPLMRNLSRKWVASLLEYDDGKQASHRSTEEKKSLQRTVSINNSGSKLYSQFNQQGFEEGFIIDRGEGNDQYAVVDTVDSNVMEYEDISLQYGTTYNYRVCAYVDTFKSVYASVDNIELVIPAPSNLIVFSDNDQAILSWTDNSIYESGFSLEKSVANGEFSVLATLDSDVVSYIDTDVIVTSDYIYRVRAFTSSNYSSYSNEYSFKLFEGEILYITPVGSDFTGNGSLNYPYKTIQKGINVASDSSLILVENGSYNESIDFSGKMLTVASYYHIDPVASHISATTISAVSGRVVTLNGTGSQLIGLTITNGNESQGAAGIYASGNVSISNCVITENSSTVETKGAGVYCAASSEITISSSTIKSNTLSGGGWGAGIYAGVNSTLSLVNTNVKENSITVTEDTIGEGAGVSSIGSTLSISNSEISDNTISSHVPLSAGYSINETKTKEWNSNGAASTFNFSLDGDIATPATIIVTAIGDYDGYSSNHWAKAYIEGELLGTIVDDEYGCEFSKTYTISGSDMANYSSDGTVTVTVQNGSNVYSYDDCYLEGSFQKKHIVKLTSSFDGVEGAGIHSSADLTISGSKINNNGIVRLARADNTGPYGGGIYASGSLTISDSEASGNGSDGIYCTSSGASYTNVTANSNGADGIYSGSGATFTSCTANSNGADGIYTTSSGTFSSCTTNQNGKHGIYCSGIGTFSSCTASNNSSYGLYSGSAGTFSSCTSSSNGSIGISSGSGTSTVDACTISGNSSNGIRIVGNGTFTSLTISDNAGSGLTVGWGTSNFTDITITNSTSGTGLYNTGTGELINVSVSGSSGDGIRSGPSTSLKSCSANSNGAYGIWVENAGFLTNCSSDGNAKGIYVGAYSSELINCLSTNNTTYGVELLNSSTLIQNCTFSGNGTGIYADGNSGPAFVNVIIYDNTTELAGSSGSNYTISYSDIKSSSTFGAWATGTGNIDANPLFIGSGNYQLQSGSPCINVGNPSESYNDTDGSRNDMGAYGGTEGNW